MVSFPTAEFQELIPKIREKGFYVSQEPRSISWPEYNQSQIDEAKETLIFIRDSVNECEAIILKGQVGRPLTDPKIVE